MPEAATRSDFDWLRVDHPVHDRTFVADNTELGAFESCVAWLSGFGYTAGAPIKPDGRPFAPVGVAFGAGEEVRVDGNIARYRNMYVHAWIFIRDNGNADFIVTASGHVMLAAQLAAAGV